MLLDYLKLMTFVLKKYKWLFFGILYINQFYYVATLFVRNFL